MWHLVLAEIGPGGLSQAAQAAECLQERWREILGVLGAAFVVGLVMAAIRWAVRRSIEPRSKRVSFGGLWIAGSLLLLLVYGLVALILTLTRGGSFERFLFETLHLGQALPTVAQCLPRSADRLYDLATPFYFPVVYALWHMVFLVVVFLLFWGVVGSKAAFAPVSRGKKRKKGEKKEAKRQGEDKAESENEATDSQATEDAQGPEGEAGEGQAGSAALPEGPLAPALGPLFQAFGYWLDLRHVEGRYKAYAEGLVFALRIARWLALPAAFLGTLPPTLWILASLLVTALKDNFQAPSLLERRRRKKKAEQETAGEGEQKSVSVPAILEGLGAEEGIADLESLGGRQAEAAKLVTSELLTSHPAMQLVAAKLGLEGRLYAHQEACFSHLSGGENVLLATAPLSGRTTVGDLLTLHQVLAAGATVLYVCPSAEAAGHRRLALSAVVSRADWDWNIFVHDLCNDRPEVLDLQMRQPNVLLTDIELLHRQLLPNHREWEFFLRSIGLVVVLDLEAYTGALGANVYWLFRRFQKVCRTYSAEPRYFATAVPYNDEIRTYAEALLGVPFVFVGPGLDTAPEPAREILAMRPKSDQPTEMPLPVLVAGVVAGLGHRAELFGFEATLTQQEEERIQEVLLALGKADLQSARSGPKSGAGVQAPGRRAEIVLAQVEASQVRLCQELTRHFGGDLLDVSQKIERISESHALPEGEPKGFAAQEEGFQLGEQAFESRGDRQGSTSAENGKGDRADARPAEGDSPEVVQQEPSEQKASGDKEQPRSYWQQTTAATLLLPAPQPFVEFLVAQRLLNKDHPDLALGCSLVTNPDNVLARAKNLTCAVAETTWTREELEEAFGKEILARKWAELADRGLVATELLARPDPEAGLVRQVEVVRYVGHPLPHLNTALETVTDEHVSVVDRRTGSELLRLDRVRALTDAYPGLVFLARRRRYRVCMPEEQSAFGQGRILADPYERPVVTSKIRVAHVRMAHPERRRRQRRRTVEATQGDERRSGRDRRAAMAHSIGGSAFFLWYPWVFFHEEVQGVKTYDRTGRLLDVTYFSRPIETRYRTRAAVVAFPTQKAPAQALHALVHLFSHVLPAFVKHGPFDLDLTYSESFGEEGLPALFILDRHPGNAGFATSVTTEVFRHLCVWAYRLAANCPARCGSPHGCLACLRSLQCHAPHGGPETDLDREATLSLLEDLLGGFVH